MKTMFVLFLLIAVLIFVFNYFMTNNPEMAKEVAEGAELFSTFGDPKKLEQTMDQTQSYLDMQGKLQEFDMEGWTEETLQKYEKSLEEAQKRGNKVDSPLLNVMDNEDQEPEQEQGLIKGIVNTATGYLKALRQFYDKSMIQYKEMELKQKQQEAIVE